MSAAQTGTSAAATPANGRAYRQEAAIAPVNLANHFLECCKLNRYLTVVDGHRFVITEDFARNIAIPPDAAAMAAIYSRDKLVAQAAILPLGQLAKKLKKKRDRDSYERLFSLIEEQALDERVRDSAHTLLEKGFREAEIKSIEAELNDQLSPARARYRDFLDHVRRMMDGGMTPAAFVEEFKAFIKANEGAIVSRLYALLARRSSTDPIAGNPASAQSQTASRDFQQGFTHKVSQVWGCASSAANEQIMLAKAGFGCTADVADLNFRLPAVEMAQIGQTQLDAGAEGLYEDYYERMARERGRNQASIGIEYAQISAQQGGGGDTLKSSMFTLPLAYTVIFDRDPRHKLAFRMPISVVDVEGASVFQAALAVGYTHALSSRWTLTPNLGYTVVGSEDLAAASALLSYSLTSSFTLDVKGWAINIGNMLGSYSTQKLKIGDYESDPGISNTVMTNGVLLSGPGSLLANDLVLEYFINDTRYSGDDLFTDNAQEFGVNIGRIRTRGEIITSYVKAGVSYLTASGDGGNKADALRVSLSYRF